LILVLFSTRSLKADIPAGYNFNQYDSDGIINEDDYDALIVYINLCGYVESTDPEYDVEFDVNGDGVIFALDALYWLNFWNSNPWQNSANRFDVNNDTYVTAADALTIANEINANGEHYFSQDDAYESPYYDVDGDNQVTENDFDEVVDYLNP
jgi:hypothetical protein